MTIAARYTKAILAAIGAGGVIAATAVGVAYEPPTITVPAPPSTAGVPFDFDTYAGMIAGAPQTPTPAPATTRHELLLPPQ